ncbi:Ribose import permease protein RbsC [subsurface metagenome]
MKSNNENSNSKIMKSSLNGLMKAAIYIWRNQKALIALIAMAIVFAFISEHFFTVGNLLNVSRQTAIIALLAAGMTLVILVGDIDLSIGANAAFCGVVAAFLLKRGVYIPFTFLIILVLGMLIGYINGIIVTKIKVPFFIATLAMMSILIGGGFLITGGYPISNLPNLWSFFGRGYLGPIPVPTIIMLLAFVILHVVLARTTFGRKIYAVGSNERTAYLCGVKTENIRIMAYALCGLIAALGGILLSSRLDSGDPSVGDVFLLTSIAAPILGGTKLSGGEGTIMGTLIGAFVLGIINNAMSLLNLNIYWQDVVRGLIVLAVVIPQIERRKI